MQSDNPDTTRSSPREVFSGWKDIASYLGKGKPTIQRDELQPYEPGPHLPVRQPTRKQHASALATKPQLDHWAISVAPIQPFLARNGSLMCSDSNVEALQQDLQETGRKDRPIPPRREDKRIQRLLAILAQKIKQARQKVHVSAQKIA